MGTIPDWLLLGDSILHGGVPSRPVLGDWSHLNECDQPPMFIRDMEAHSALHTADRGEDRKPVVQRCPGKPIAELKGRHSGRVAILFNGASLDQHDLYKIKCPIIGMNRTHAGYPTYNGPQPDYLCIVDWFWFDKKRRESVLDGSCS